MRFVVDELDAGQSLNGGGRGRSPTRRGGHGIAGGAGRARSPSGDVDLVSPRGTCDRGRSGRRRSTRGRRRSGDGPSDRQSQGDARTDNAPPSQVLQDAGDGAPRARQDHSRGDVPAPEQGQRAPPAAAPRGAHESGRRNSFPLPPPPPPPPRGGRQPRNGGGAKGRGAPTAKGKGKGKRDGRGKGQGRGVPHPDRRPGGNSDMSRSRSPSRDRHQARR